MKNELIETAKALKAVPWCCAELKDACDAWIAAVGTCGEKAAAEALIKELEEDVMPIDATIAFFSSPAAAEHFGAEEAKKGVARLTEAKAAGAKYCDCDACALGAKLLENRAALLEI